MLRPTESDPAPAILVNGEAISEATIREEMQHHPASRPEAARRAASEALVVRSLLLQEAQRLGVEAEPKVLGEMRWESEEEALVRALLEREIEVPEPDRAACRTYYDHKPARFRSPDLYEARHILYAADPADRGAYEAAERKAALTLDRLRERPGDFESLAKAESDCSSAKDGGHLGQVTRGQTVPEFETFLVNLEAGQLCPVPVKTRYGVHVVKLEQKEEGRQLPFEAVEELIADYLRESVWRRALHQYIQVLAGRAEIEGFDFAAADSPLVQ